MLDKNKSKTKNNRKHTILEMK